MRECWWKLRAWFTRLKRLRDLDDVSLFLRIVSFAAVLPVLLRLRLSRLPSLLEPSKAPQNAEPARIHEIITCVDLMLGLWIPAIRRRCLVRGVTLYYFLRRAGLDVALCFGMGNIKGELAGHCWLIKAGAPFLEAQDPRPVFTELYRISRKTPVAGAIQASDR